MCCMRGSHRRRGIPLAPTPWPLSREFEGARLHGMAGHGDRLGMVELIRRGADIDHVPDDWHGTSPIMNAVQGKRTWAVKLLLGKGADPLKKDGEGWDALKWAAVVGHVASAKSIVSHLRKRGIDERSAINSPDHQGRGALDLAERHPKMRKYLCALGAVELRPGYKP